MIKDPSQALNLEDFLPTEDERREAQIAAITLGIHLLKTGAGRLEIPVDAGEGKNIKVTVELQPNPANQ